MRNYPNQPASGPPAGPGQVRHLVHYRPHTVRRARDVGVPVALMVVGAILIGFLVLLTAASSPQMFAIGVIPSTLALVVGLSAYMWLDQWEPEPPRLLLAAFIWGGGIATAGTLGASWLFGLLGAPQDYAFSAVIEAPILEEALKGAFLFLMLTGARRRQMRTLVDHLVYAGFVGFGFAFVENLLYFASAQTLSDTIFMAIVRTGFNLFGHSFYTSAIAVGIYLGRKHQGSTRTLYYIAGYVAAVLLHSLWNGAATLLGGIGLITVYFLVLTPAFIALVRQGVRARNHEGQVIAAQLPRMVHEGLVTHQEAQWISALPNRAAMRRQLKGQDAQLARARNLVEAVVELAIIRDRSLGEPSPFEEQEEVYLVQAILAERQLLPGSGFGWPGPGQPPGGTVPPRGPYPPSAGYPTGGGFGG